MTVHEKRAYLGMIAAGLAILCYVIQIPFRGPEHALSGFAAIALSALVPLIGRKEGPPDERDRSILSRAMLIGAKASYASFIVSTLAVWAYHYVKGLEQMPVYAMITIVWIGASVFLFVQCAAALVLYRRHGEADHG